MKKFRRFHEFINFLLGNFKENNNEKIQTNQILEKKIDEKFFV